VVEKPVNTDAKGKPEKGKPEKGKPEKGKPENTRKQPDTGEKEEHQKQLGRGQGMSIPQFLSPSIKPLQQQLDHTLPVANIANHQIGLAVDQYPSCDTIQCNAWPKKGPRPTGPYSATKPLFKNAKKKTKKEKESLKKWQKTGDLIALLSE